MPNLLFNMKRARKLIAYSIAIILVITIVLSIVAIYQMGYNTDHYREKDIEAINQATFENRYSEHSRYKDIIISKEESLKNYYEKDSVFDIDREDYEIAKLVLETSFPKEIIMNGDGYKCVESGNLSSADSVISMFPIDRYFKQYLGILRHGRKSILVYLTTEYTPEYVGQFVLYKGLPPEEITVTIDLTSEKLSL